MRLGPVIGISSLLGKFITVGFAKRVARPARWLLVTDFSRRLCPLCLVLVLTCGGIAPSRLSAQTFPPGDDLTQAQIENQRAQAKYYQRQADKRGFWRNLRDFGGPIGAAVAAVVAIVSFALSYRATLRSREDLEFYQALKLFGDRENPNVRSSAAGLLEQMASRQKRYYVTAFNQLSAELHAEEQEKTRDSILTAISRLVRQDPLRSMSKLEAINRALGNSLAETFCRFCIARGVKAIEEIPDAVWEEAEEIAAYDRHALNSLLLNLPKDNLVSALNSARRRLRTLGRSDYEVYSAATRIDLGDASEQIRLNIKSISEALLSLGNVDQRISLFNPFIRRKTPSSFVFLVGGKFRDFRNCRICRAVLREADFASAKMQRAVLLDADLSNANLSYATLTDADCRGTKFVGAVLKQADLTGTKFQNSDLSGADLTGARFRNTSIAPAAFERTEWWKADFGRQRDLLKAIYTDYKKNLPDLENLYVRGEIHQSVLNFIGKITEERL